MKLCRDCEHRSGFSWFSKCRAPQNFAVNLVTGRRGHKRWEYCSAHRIGHADHESCGEIGSWWEPRQSTLKRVIKIFSRN